MANVKRSAGSDWREGFLFLGNHLALDFLNTRPVQNGEPHELLPDFNAVLRWFRAASLLSSHQVDDLRRQWGESVRGREMTAALHELREKLRHEIIAWEDTGKLHRGFSDVLNQIMAEHPMLTRLNRNTNEVMTELWFEARRPEDLFAPLAYAVALLFSSVDRSRVRKCGHCVLHFYDTSKKGTRRWCSMQLCGNRLKVAAYAVRQRAHK
ncbi:MAG: CGNR zinc finger domain-containing protein [Acidobacteriaceae bacterium]|nr:CGNR zinc finger domain-containing protein [Acidobacteriaceae bacterium]